MMIGTAVCWAAFWLIIHLVDPIDAGSLGLLFFYLALGLSVSGTLALSGLVVRIHVLRIRDVLSRQVLFAFREAFLAAMLLCGALFLQARGWFSFLNAVLLIGVVFLLEIFFLSVRRPT